MCGGKSKSSIFALHNCDSTQSDLQTADGKAKDLSSDMDKNVNTANGLASDMQKAAEDLQKAFGAVGDSAATGLLQKAKESAGKLEHGAEDVDALSKELKDLSSRASKITDFKSSDEVTEAERIMENIDASVAKSAAANAKLEKRIELASPSPDDDGAAKEYFPVMYFVDRKYESLPSTCGGDMVNDPIVGESPAGCATACNNNFQTCVGFQYFGPEKLCFLLSKFGTASYYTGCNKAAFLQEKKGDSPPDVTCYAKLSRFEGTSLKPDGSGKCKECLRKATKADRCYK